MSKLITLISCPAGGKSTWANNYIQDSLNYETIVISTDSIRGEVTGKESDCTQEKIVWEIAYTRLHEALSGGNDVIFDACSQTKKARSKLIKIARETGAKVEAIYFNTPLSVCLERNKLRERFVPEEIIKRMKNTTAPPELSEGIDEITEIKWKSN